MINYTSKIIHNTILCLTILSMIDELKEVQSHNTSTELSDTDYICTRKDISLESYIMKFSMDIIDTFHIRCHLTMLKYIENGLPEDVKIDDIKHYNYMILRSCTSELFYSTPDMKLDRFKEIEKWTDNTDVKSEIKKFFPDSRNVHGVHCNDNIHVYDMLERNETELTITNYECCKTILSTLSEPTNELKTIIISIFKTDNIQHKTKKIFPTIYFGFILYLMKIEEVEKYKTMEYGDRLNYINDIINQGLLDIFRGLTYILYKSNLKILLITNSQQEEEGGKQIKDFARALYQVFSFALDTADNFYILKDNNGKQQQSKKKPPIDEYMNHVMDYGLSNETKYNPDNIPKQSRLFKDNKLQPSILQYYSVLACPSKWKLPFIIPSGMNEMEVLLLELNGWLKVIDYVVMDYRFVNKYNRIPTNIISTYKEWVVSAIPI